MLTSEDAEPDVDTGLVLDELETAPGGYLWRISGKGILSIGEKRYKVETKAEEEALEARLIPFGETLPGWRLEGKAPVYRGEANFYGQLGASSLIPVPPHELRRSPGRLLGSEIVEWVRENETLARLRLVRLPATVRFSLREDAPGRVAFTAEGLKRGWRVRLRAGQDETTVSDVENGPVRLMLETPGRAPGLVSLRLSELATGTALDLQAAWPARKGMILDPEGMRLTRNQWVSVESLHGWRAVAPDGSRCDLELQFVGQPATSLPVTGEESLTAHLPLIRAMLAQGKPDAQLNLRLVVDGQESNRLEIRRYHGQAVVSDGILRAGFERDEPVAPETALAAELSKARSLTFHAVDTGRPEQVKRIETTGRVNLRAFLGDEGGPWLIQSRLEGQVQRAAVWTPDPIPVASREDRLSIYVQEWKRLVSAPEDQEWDRLWRLIKEAGHGGDAGVLDQVQALAKVPAAVICLALRVSPEELSEVQVLDTVTPVFWPVLPVRDFTEAVVFEHKRQLARYAPFFDEREAEEEADATLVKRIGEILALQPELAGHFRKALADAGLFGRIIHPSNHQEIPAPLLISNPSERLAEISQEAVKRFDRLPDGLSKLAPRSQPSPNLSFNFNPYAQQMIDAPLVTAEMAAGLRPAPSVAERLTLIRLRHVDPIYFDTALPLALYLYLETP